MNGFGRTWGISGETWSWCLLVTCACWFSPSFSAQVPDPKVPRVPNGHPELD